MGSLLSGSSNEATEVKGANGENGANGATFEPEVKKEVPTNGTAPATIHVNETAGGKRKGGYRPTKKDKAALKKLKQGKSIGFTMRSSLKAKGLLRRANGTMRISAKYKKN